MNAESRASFWSAPAIAAIESLPRDVQEEFAIELAHVLVS